jgi:hypothetical protein
MDRQKTKEGIQPTKQDTYQGKNIMVANWTGKGERKGTVYYEIIERQCKG